jgi:renalase
VTKRAAVIGAGLAGLSCARTLRRAGFFVEVFEQDRMIGGRMATTRLGMETFDHGAQYVTARSKEFKDYLDEVTGLGYAARWNPRARLNGEEGAGQMLPWYVGTPGMASIVRPLAESVRIHTGRKVHTLDHKEKGWHVWFEDETSVGPFHAVAVTVPAAQARLLLGRVEEISQPLARVRMMPDQDVFSDMSEVIRWIGRNNTKPGRSRGGESIVIHASPSWSRQSEDAEPELIAEDLWGEVSHVLGLPPVRPVRMMAHLWQHGLVDQSLGETYIYSRDHKVGVAGDWCLGRLAEHAFESGNRLGRAIIESLN